MCCVKVSPRFAARDTGPVWTGIRTRYVYRYVVCWCPCDSPCAVSCVSRPWNLAKRGVAEAALAFNAGVGSGIRTTLRRSPISGDSLSRIELPARQGKSVLPLHYRASR